MSQYSIVCWMIFISLPLCVTWLLPYVFHYCCYVLNWFWHTLITGKSMIFWNSRTKHLLSVKKHEFVVFFIVIKHIYLTKGLKELMLFKCTPDLLSANNEFVVFILMLIKCDFRSFIVVQIDAAFHLLLLSVFPFFFSLVVTVFAELVLKIVLNHKIFNINF